MKRTIAILFLLALPHMIVAAEPVPLPPAPAGQTWKLVWNDEFDGDSIDRDKWEIIGDMPRKGGFWLKEDSYLDGQGHLVLRIKKDGERYTCGGIRTEGKYERRFGLFAARCQIPREAGVGHHSAFWMHARSVTRVGDEGRDGTEIDIMEKFHDDDSVQHALHWDGYGEHHQSASKKIVRPGIREGFHVFALYWTPEEYVFYIDGEETWRTNAGGVSQVPSFMQLTTEITTMEGKTWNGKIETANLPDYFLTDWARVYDAVAAE